MAVAIVLDFPGGKKSQYDEVLSKMDLGGKLPSGGMFHAAGSHDGGWRVIDVWESREQFERFAQEKIGPLSVQSGLGEPQMRMIEVETVREAGGGAPVVVQVVTLPGLDSASFHAADDKIVPGDAPPAGMTFHVSGPVDDGWCVIDAWASEEERDSFIETRALPGMADAPLTGEPRFETLTVEATLGAGTHAPA